MIQNTTRTTEFQIHAETLSLYEMTQLPMDLVYLPKHREYIGSLCYTLTLREPYTIRYVGMDDIGKEEYHLHILASVDMKKYSLPLGQGLYIEDNRERYVCMYRVSSESSVHAAIDGEQTLVRMHLIGEQLLTRTSGDQVSQIYIPDSSTVESHGNIHIVK